ncbi:MAG: hypothetical protein KDC98_08980 [Planctomycetes bacterium]|nr:hypothetical protein [Planctomycetota bacterium]
MHSTSMISLATRTAVAMLFAIALLPAQVVAWALVEPAGMGPSFVPDPAYMHTPGGQPIGVFRDPLQQNRFIVSIPGVAPASGIVHVCAYGGNHTAVVNGWNAAGLDVQAFVELFDASGGPADDAAFVIRYRRGGPATMASAYVLADDPIRSSYTPAAVNWNGNRAPVTIVRNGTGEYTVTMPGLGGSPSGEFGHVQVCAYGQSPLRARIHRWSTIGADVTVDVDCSAMSGLPADGRFVLSYHEEAAPIPDEIGAGAHVSFYSTTTPIHRTRLVDSNGTYGPREAESIHHLATGRYRVDLPNVAPRDSSTAMVCAIDLLRGYASIDHWDGDGRGGTRVYVDTYDPGGAPADRVFLLDYLTDRPTREVAWATVEPVGQGTTITPRPELTHTASGLPVAVYRANGTRNEFRVLIPAVLPEYGAVHATAMWGSHTAVVEFWRRSGAFLEVFVKLFDATGGPADDGAFVISYERGGEHADRHAYLWAGSPTSASYTPSTTYSWNGDRADPTIVRSGVGLYAVTLPGLAPAGIERGNVQVTTYGTQFRHTKIDGWFANGADLRINVRCFDAAGAAADAQFVLSYNEVAAPIPERMGSGGHVYANDPTSASYTPFSMWTDSNGTLGPANAERVHRQSTGLYAVDLPDLAPFASSMAQVSAYGTGTAYAAVHHWGSGPVTGARVYVSTFDIHGVPIDARFSLRYLTNRPAVGTPATNTTIGSGCNGPTLSGLTRPIAGSDWQLELSGVPATAVLGFMQLGLSNPGLAFGPTAPGCTQYTSAQAVALLLTPIPSPAYTLSIPPGLALLGLPIFAQGGALVPGVNALSLAASNGVQGVIGNV